MAVVGVALWSLEGALSRAAEALLLVVPVLVVAALGGRRAAYAVVVVATVAFALVIPPVGSVRVAVAEDLAALGVFSVVALAMGDMVARRIDAIEAVERQQVALLRSVSHDLRTPITAIRAAASELADNPRLPSPTAQHFNRIIEDEAERLDRLVANLLSLSRIEAGAFGPRRQAVDVAELVAATSNRLRRLVAGVDLRLDVPGGLPSVQADYVQLDQLLTNLVENAVRHSPPGGRVLVSARATATHLVLSVADEGPGVAPEEAAHMFEPFATGAHAGLSGVGLAICRAVADAHAGTIDVGVSESGGAVFTFRIPLG
mgnify:CR=1 FL=1